jgi:TPR repeat protein
MERDQMDCVESRIEAYKWFHLAAAQGYKGSAAACERVTLGMTREEVTDGNQRAAAFEVRKSACQPVDSLSPNLK